MNLVGFLAQVLDQAAKLLSPGLNHESYLVTQAEPGR